MSKLLSTAIIGANGYSGRELARLLLRHPHATLSATLGRQASWQLSDDLPEASAQQVPHYPLNELGNICAVVDTIFLATPPEVSLELLPQLINTNTHIIDLSAALRLPTAEYTAWYGQAHPNPSLLTHATYGLSPWCIPAHSPSTYQLIANPGCYATAALMTLLPLLKASIIQNHSIIIDAKSGLSGAGRHLQQQLLFCEAAQDFYPYKIGCHQHTPEIDYYLKKLGTSNEFSEGNTVDTTANLAKPILTTHILPVKRGISMTIYPHFTSHCDHLATAELTEQILQAYHLAYADYPLIHYTDLTQTPTHKQQKLLSLTHVVGSARIHIAWHIVNRQLILFATIDNLLKGAASQAIENFNWLHALPCNTSLDTLEGLL